MYRCDLNGVPIKGLVRVLGPLERCYNCTCTGYVNASGDISQLPLAISSILVSCNKKHALVIHSMCLRTISRLCFAIVYAARTVVGPLSCHLT